MVRQLVHQAQCQIAMRINDSQAMAIRHVLQNQIFQQARFTGAGLADHIQVEKAILMSEAEGLIAGAGIGGADDGDGLVHPLSVARLTGRVMTWENDRILNMQELTMDIFTDKHVYKVVKQIVIALFLLILPGIVLFIALISAVASCSYLPVDRVPLIGILIDDLICNGSF